MTLTRSVEMVNDGEPLIVMTDSSGRFCEHKDCEAKLVHRTLLPPVRYVCSRHVVAAFNELLEARRERRRVT